MPRSWAPYSDDHRVDARLAQRADLVVGERAVGGPEPQREREADLAGAERVGAEHVEQRDVLEQLARRRARASPATRAGGNGVVDDEREVDRRRREARHRPGAAFEPGSPRAARRRRARTRRPAPRAPSASTTPAATSPMRPTGCRRRARARRGPGADPSTVAVSSRSVGEPQLAARARRAPRSRRRRRPGGRARAARAAPRATARTRDGRARRAACSPRSGGANTVPVSNSATSGSPCAALNATDAQHAGQQRGPQDRLLGAQRVLDLDHVVGRRHPAAVEVGRREQRQRVDLVVARADEHVGDRAARSRWSAREAADLLGARRHGARDAVEADAPRDFLDEVDLALEVGTERRARPRRRRASSMPSGVEVRARSRRS